MNNKEDLIKGELYFFKPKKNHGVFLCEKDDELMIWYEKEKNSEVLLFEKNTIKSFTGIFLDIERLKYSLYPTRGFYIEYFYKVFHQSSIIYLMKIYTSIDKVEYKG